MADEERDTSREEEWRMVREVSAEEEKAIKAYMARSYHELQEAEGRIEQAIRNSETSRDIAARRQRELDAHDRMMMRSGTEAARDALHDNGPGKEPGAYTVHEARDRAGHTPGAHRMEPEK